MSCLMLNMSTVLLVTVILTNNHSYWVLIVMSEVLEELGESTSCISLTVWEKITKQAQSGSLSCLGHIVMSEMWTPCRFAD